MTSVRYLGRDMQSDVFEFQGQEAKRPELWAIGYLNENYPHERMRGRYVLMQDHVGDPSSSTAARRNPGLYLEGYDGPWTVNHPHGFDTCSKLNSKFWDQVTWFPGFELVQVEDLTGLHKDPRMLNEPENELTRRNRVRYTIKAWTTRIKALKQKKYDSLENESEAKRRFGPGGHEEGDSSDRTPAKRIRMSPESYLISPPLTTSSRERNAAQVLTDNEQSQPQRQMSETDRLRLEALKSLLVAYNVLRQSRVKSEDMEHKLCSQLQLLEGMSECKHPSFQSILASPKSEAIHDVKRARTELRQHRTKVVYHEMLIYAQVGELEDLGLEEALDNLRGVIQKHLK
ncbi:hypothetical protein BT63DRAFT_460588 [Microthyrium microscopicum]|uniref:Uncharacterized protein n=1 Tax=Microthyrium microscopicum TaxID=703497 RepID=A0A6A6TWU5_9PEZI|nr:hypothetical protein BT63DRAFT_460588 [Microthyrium microscopicum]